MQTSNVILFGLLETKVKKAKAHRVSHITNLVAHPGERIWIVWNTQIYTIDVNMSTTQFIHAEVQNRRD